MTTIRRVTFSLPADLADEIMRLRLREEYMSYSYSELVRMLITVGLNSKHADNACCDNA